MRLLISIILAAFFSLSQASVNLSAYNNSLQLLPDYKIYWRVEGNEIFLAFQVITTGFIGFGISEPTSGSMPGSDILYTFVNDTTGEVVANDMWSYGYIAPVRDSGCQNWVPLNGTQVNGITTIEVKRNLIANETQDRSIPPGLVSVIFSHSSNNEDTLSYHGVNNRGISKILFYGSAGPELPQLDNSTQTIDIKMQNANLPAAFTTYMCESFFLPNDTDYHIIAAEPIINPANVQNVHHLLIHICADIGATSAIEMYKSPTVCSSPLGQVNIGCTGLIFAWALGGGNFTVPSEAGFRIGKSALAIKSIVLEIHYTNPTYQSGIVDNSGIKFYYTSDLRPSDAGVIILGDPFVTSAAIPPLNPYNHYEMSCNTNCTTLFTQPINVFGSFLHMHEIGKMVWTTLWKGGNNYAGITDRIEFWDFNIQQTTTVNFTINPGDRLNVHCVYDSSAMTTATTFGRATINEMCMNIISYYPLIYYSAGLPYSFCGYAHSGASNYTMCNENFLAITNPVFDFIQSNDQTNFGLPVGSNFNNSFCPMEEYVVASSFHVQSSINKHSRAAVTKADFMPIFVFAFISTLLCVNY